MLKLDRMFGKHMVLQREKQIPVWGQADAGSVITVKIEGKTYCGKVEEDGTFCVAVGPMTAGVCLMMEVKRFASEEAAAAGTEVLDQVTIKDVAVGEVWLAGGQSNMEFHMRFDADFAEEKEHLGQKTMAVMTQASQIRFFDYPEVTYDGQIDEEPYAEAYAKNYAFWRTCDPENLERFSAVAYYFAKKIQEAYGIPVGIIGCNWGGTKASSWMSKEALAAAGGQIYLDEYEAALKELDLAEYEEKFRANPGNYHTDLLADPISNMMLEGATKEEFMAAIQKMTGMDLSQMDLDAMRPQLGPKSEQRPAGLYDAMLTKVAPYGIRGFIYYQGESDGDAYRELYETIFPGLIENWRTLWGDPELPFLFTQIAPLEQWMDCKGKDYIEIRRAQQVTEDTVAGAHMVTTSDAGMQWDIHPKKKKPVGERLALQARHYVYGEKVLSDAPRLVDAEVSDGELALIFENAGKGLKLVDQDAYGNPVDGDALGGLVIIQNGEKLEGTLEAEVTAKDTVSIFSDEIDADAEILVEIGQTGWYVINLVNSEGIAARPEKLVVQ